MERQREERQGDVVGKNEARSGNGAASVALDASVAWPTMDEAAYYGLAGDVVRTIVSTRVMILKCHRSLPPDDALLPLT
jgi:hypothetical protein